MMQMYAGQDEAVEARTSRGYGGLFYGVYPALVTDIEDPTGQGRVRIRLPWSPDGGSSAYEAWARIATTMAGNNRGTWFIPDVNDEVLVSFQAGDPRYPYVIGGLWNGQDSPHETISSENNIKSIRSREGIKITMDDAAGATVLTLETPGGHTITLDDGGMSVEVRDSSGNSIKMESSGITVTAAAKVTVNAGQVEISAGMVTVNAGMSRFSGVVQADTVIANSVVSASYTPGAGNIW